MILEVIEQKQILDFEILPTIIYNIYYMTSLLPKKTYFYFESLFFGC